MNNRINVTEAMRQFAAGQTSVYESLASTGNKLQMARYNIVQAMTPEDVKTLHDFATDLMCMVRFQQAGMSTAEPRSDDPAGPDGTTYPDQHKR